MKRFRQIVLSLLAAVALLAMLVAPVGAANPTVTITVTASVVSINNTQSAWAIGIVTVDAVVYFSATGAQNDSYSTITNTGSVMIDVDIKGTDIDGTGALDWTLASAAGAEQYSLYATNESNAGVYDIEVKSAAAYSHVCSGLPSGGDDTTTWSMNFTAPSSFNAAEDGLQKTATVTLIAHAS